MEYTPQRDCNAQSYNKMGYSGFSLGQNEPYWHLGYDMFFEYSHEVQGKISHIQTGLFAVLVQRSQNRVATKQMTSTIWFFDKDIMLQ